MSTRVGFSYVDVCVFFAMSDRQLCNTLFVQYLSVEHICVPYMRIFDSNKHK